jgi:hypothetical protein
MQAMHNWHGRIGERFLLSSIAMTLSNPRLPSVCPARCIRRTSSAADVDERLLQSDLSVAPRAKVGFLNAKEELTIALMEMRPRRGSRTGKLSGRPLPRECRRRAAS